MDEVSGIVVGDVEAERLYRIPVSGAPVLHAEHFLPLVIETIEATVKNDGEVWAVLRGRVAKKDGAPSNRSNKVWYYSDFRDKAPKWLVELVDREIAKAGS